MADDIRTEGDGTDHIDAVHEKAFIQWLQDNGATWDAIIWPSRDTVGRVRGAVAARDIEEGDCMMYIPKDLMLSVQRAHACPIIGHVFAELPDLFERDEDKTLALYVVNERSRGPSSFWLPYFNIIGEPLSTSDWSTEELAELQCEGASSDALNRAPFIKSMYSKMMKELVDKYPHLFSLETHTLQSFDWAWRHIQARAFGRRLPYTSLVPLADMLNHANVATLYSYEHDTFMLYPSDGNFYEKGREAFNSYGRRNNRFLLLEYGFCLMNNMHERFKVSLELKFPGDKGADIVKAVAAEAVKLGIKERNHFELAPGKFHPEYLLFFRLRNIIKQDDLLAELIQDGESPYTGGVMTIASEKVALEEARQYLIVRLRSFLTSIQDDEAILSNKVMKQKLHAAVVYRLTRKKLLKQHIKYLDKLIETVNGTEKLSSDILAKFEKAPTKVYAPYGMEARSILSYREEVAGRKAMEAIRDSLETVSLSC